MASTFPIRSAPLDTCPWLSCAARLQSRDSSDNRLRLRKAGAHTARQVAA